MPIGSLGGGTPARPGIPPQCFRLDLWTERPAEACNLDCNPLLSTVQPLVQELGRLSIEGPHQVLHAVRLDGHGVTGMA